MLDKRAVPESRPFAFTLCAWAVITVVTIAICSLTKLVCGWLGIVLPDQANISAVKSIAGFNIVFLKVCAMVLILAPVSEELIFRFPLRFLRAPAWWIVFALLFTAAHYIDEQTQFPDAAFIALFFFGLAQGLLYRLTKRIWCSILSHALFNLTNLILLFVLPE